MRRLLDNLRFRLISLVLLAVIPALGLVLYTGLVAVRQDKRDAQSAALQLARAASNNQTQAIEDTRNLLVTLAELPQIRSIDPAAARGGPAREACSAPLARLLKQYTRYANLTVTAANGDLLCSAVPAAGTLNYADRGWYQAAMQKRDFVVGSYVFGKLLRKPQLPLAYPILNEAGQVQSVLAVSIGLDWVDDLWAQARLQGEPALLVVDRQGTILARHPDPEQWVGKTMPEAPIVQALLKGTGEGVTEVAGVDGVLRLWAFAPLGDPSDVAAYVGVGFSTRTAYTEAERGLTRNLVLLGAVALLALVVAWGLGNRLVLHSMEVKARSQRLLLALSQAAEAVQRARAPAEVFQTVGSAVTGLGYNAVILMPGEDRGYLDLRHTTFPPEALHVAEGLAGLSAEGLRVAVSPGSIIAPVIFGGRPLFIERLTGRLAEILPAERQAAADAIALDVGHAIYAPLGLKGEDCGLLAVFGADLTANDVPAMTTFAAQAATALENARLHQETQQRAAALGESLSTQQSFFDSAPIMMGVVELAGADVRHLNDNAASARFFGASPAAMRNRLASALGMPPAILDIWVTHYREAERTGQPVRFTYLHGEGPGARWLSVAVAPIPVVRASLPRFSYVAEDTTDRKRADDLVRIQRDLGLALSTAIDLEQGLRLCLNAALRVSGMDRGGVYLADKTGTLALVFHEGLPAAFVESAARFEPDSPTGQRVISGQSEYAEHLQRDTQRGEDPRATAVVPIRHEGHVIGALSVASQTFDEVSAFARGALETIAVQIGMTVARLRVEASLRDSEERFRLLVDNTPDYAIVMLDPAGCVISWNEGAERLKGYRREEIIGRHFSCFYSLEDAALGAPERNLEVAKRDGHFVDEGWRTRKDGSLFWASVTLSALRDAAGNLRGFGKVTRNMTERKRAEERLAELLDLNQTIIAASPVGIAVFKASGQCILANQTMARIVGGGIGDLLQLDFHQFPSWQKSGLLAAAEQALATGNKQQLEVQLVTTFDREVWLDEFLARVTSGGEAHLLVIANDVTERERAAQALRAYTTRLEQSNRDLEEFAYVASHDLQEPLRKILAFSDRLVARFGGSLDDTGRDYLDRMRGASQRMQVLIEDLLAYSRVSTRGQPFAPVDLTVIAKDVVSDLEGRIELAAARVEVGDLPSLEADPTQMRQLLQNLIANALKFHAVDRPPVVQVSARPADDLQYQIVVADNGIGFEPQYVDRIFKPFRRLHTRDEYEGTGMGLAICRRIAERHHGTITAAGAPGQGATFIVTLPIHQPEGETSG